MTPDTTVRIGSLTMRNPVMVASGTAGYGEELARWFPLSELGALVVKGTTLAPRAGNPPPRVWETPAGMLNAIGLQNDGLEGFLERRLPRLREHDVPVIVNIAGETPEEFAELARRLDAADGVAALELNVSCPNVKAGGMMFGRSPEAVAEVTRLARAQTRLPLLVKLSPNVTDIVEVACAAAEAGADGLSLVNTFLAMAIDVRTRRPRLANVTGGLSGPAIRPIAVRMVWEVAQAVDLPIVGMGGIISADDALEFIIAGASAVAVGTATFVNPRAAVEVARGIRRYLEEQGIARIADLVGSLQIPEQEKGEEQ